MWKIIQSKYIGKNIPIIKVHGIIDTKMTDQVMRQLNAAKPIKGSSLAVSINSRGGQPVQSHIIGSKLRDYAKQHNLKLYTFAGDYAASGGYYILCMGDEVYADRTSLVGNIGVILTRFNFKGIKQKTGIQSRIISSKDESIYNVFNPFEDMTQKQRQFVQNMAKQGHKMFVNHVNKYRGNKIKPQNQELIYSSDIFTGQKAKQIGLVDGNGTIAEIMKQKQPDGVLKFQQQNWIKGRLML